MRLPRLLRPLRHPPMALLWGGLALSSIGDQANAIAFTWIAVEAFGPAAGYLVAMGPLVILLVLTFGGRLADRWAPLRAMLGDDAIRAVALLGVVAAWSAGSSPVALLAAAALLAIQRRAALPAARSVLPAGNMLASMLHGVRVIRRHSLLTYMLAATGLLNGAWYAVFFLILPLLVTRDGLVGPGVAAYGAVISAYGCTNLLANLVIGSRPMPARPGRQIFLGNLIMGVGLCGLAVIEAAGLPRRALLPAYAACAAFCAVGGPMQDIPVAVLTQTELPRPDIRSATRAFIAANQGGLLLGLLIAPALLELLPLALVVALCGAMIITFGTMGLRRYT